MKYLFDKILSCLGFCILAPLFLVLSVLIKFEDRGPVFYRGVRVGQYGRPFRVFKFRTMGVDAEEQGASSTSDDDPRITRIGKFLRKYKLDELPQLINVLKGNMGLGGPRPEDPRYAAQYTPEQKRILSVRPGITSAASLAFRKEEQMLIGPDWERIYCAEVLPAKLTMDLAYFSRRTLFSDIFLIIRTILSIFH